jgi:mannose-P-dolichol utilization defect protein 1
MEAFEKLMSFFMTPTCYEDLFYNMNFLNVVCLKMIVSKCLGYGILAGSVLLRIPQILKICQSKSAKGISVISELLTIIAIFGSMSYGYLKQFTIVAYGDVYFLYAQSVIVLLLVLFYQNQTLQMIAYIPLIAGVTAALFLNAISTEIILALNGLSLLFSVFSKIIQAVENYRNGSTGALSSITLILQFLGCVARIFTSIQETGDTYLVVTYIANSFANGLLVWQLFYYWNTATQKKIKQKKTN